MDIDISLRQAIGTLNGNSLGNYMSICESFDSGKVVVTNGQTNRFHHALETGDIVETQPYSVYRTRLESTPGSVPLATYPSYWYGCDSPASTWSGEFCGPGVSSVSLPDFGEADWEYLKQQAEGRARTQGLDLLTEIAEFPKTLLMVRNFRKNLTSRVKRIAREARRRQKRKGKLAKALWQEFGDAWLELRYGWRPLIYSAQDLIGAIETMRRGEDCVARGYAQQKDSLQPEVELGFLSQYFHVWDKDSSNITAESERRARAHVILKLWVGSAAINLSPLGTLWEITPYSFVVDWFFNVADVLAANKPLPGLKDRAQGISEKITHNVNAVIPVNSTPSGYCTFTATPAECQLTHESYTREPHAAFSGIDLSLRANVNIAKAIDLIFLSKGFLNSFRDPSLRI